MTETFWCNPGRKEKEAFCRSAVGMEERTASLGISPARVILHGIFKQQVAKEPSLIFFKFQAKTRPSGKKALCVSFASWRQLPIPVPQAVRR